MRFAGPVSLLFFLAGCTQPGLPEPGSDAYRETVTAFYKSVASVQSGEGVGAETNLLRATELAPDEPALWYNRGLLALRANEFDAGRPLLDKARALAPENSQIVLLQGVLASNEARPDSAMAHFREAIALDPASIKARYALVQEINRLGDPALQAEAAAQLGAILDRLPANKAILIERLRIAAAENDAATASRMVDTLAGLSASWPPEAREPLASIRAALANGDLPSIRVQSGFLRNLLLGTFSYRQDLSAVQTPLESIGDLMTTFVRLPAPSPAPAAADLQLSYRTEPLSVTARWADAVSLTGESFTAIYIEGPTLVVGEQRLDVSDVLAASDRFGVATLDYSYDFRNDVAVAGAGGLALFQQDSLGIFTRVPVPAAGSFSAVWAADVDSEGDIDLILATAGPPLVLRNNGDVTFAPLPAFTEVNGAVAFAWADFDGDGDPDAALVDNEGMLHTYLNQRLGQFVHETPGPIDAPIRALTAADINADAILEIIA
ncbi:MAG: FG-GAP-like repeat-containing protein, partial [Rhodothermales bacterium]|nr:FG-GAP-like repeat-containing protein [Rhodothermales bacterium]